MNNEEIAIERDDVQKIIEANKGITRGIDLSKRNMAGIDLSGLDLRGIDFSDSIFRSGTGSTAGPAAKLDNSNFEGCNLKGTIFAASSMKYTNMGGTNARRADFSSADLTEANFHVTCPQ